MGPPMQNWTETYRGTVPPWQCDVTEHFTIAYYFDRLDEAEPSFAESLGLGELLRVAAFPRHFNVRFARELRAGSSFHVESAPLGFEGGLRLGHPFFGFPQWGDGDLDRGALGAAGGSGLGRAAAGDRRSAWGMGRSGGRAAAGAEKP